MKTLILTEKPSVAMDFAKALGITQRKDGYMENDAYVITWAVGHLVELYKPEDYDEQWKRWRMESLPILPGQFQYKPIERTQKQLGIIKKLLAKKSVNEIVIATDAGREGEVIARTILLFSDVSDTNRLKRFWTSQALTPQVVKDGMKDFKPASEYDRLWNAGKSRQIADWLVGMNGSRAATIRMNDLFSVGRVQTAVLSLLTDRRRERENFKPEPYWLVRALFANDKGNWWGNWFKKDQTRLDTEQKAKELQAKIDGQIGTVHSVKKQKKKLPPPLLYALTDLQQDGNKKFGFSAERTLQIAQALYEQKKCLSYPRTDAKVLGSKNIGMVRSLVKKLSPSYPEIFANINEKHIVGSNKRVFNDAKLTDHHALIPLAPIGNANADEKRIYELVLKRFAAAFHPDCQYEQTEIITKVEKENFRTAGKRILDPGWQVVYEASGNSKTTKPASPDTGEEPENLPPLAKGDPAAVTDTRIDKKQTTPPPEYTEALLLKDMTNPGRYVSEDELKKIYRGDVGLGTQATRAQIIETLLARKYAERRKKHLIATDKGCRLIDTLRQSDGGKLLTSPEQTARWEMQLDRISRGEETEDAFLDGIRNFVAQIVKEFKMSSVQSHPAMGQCPECGGNIIEGKRGYGCSNWREKDGGCRFVIWKIMSGKLLMPQMITKLLSEKQLGPLRGFHTEDQEEFAAVIRLVKEDEKWEARIEPSEALPDAHLSEDALGECPICGGEVIEKPKCYSCSNWDSQDRCPFVIWKTIATREIDGDIARQLLSGKKIGPLEGFVSKKGEPFTAWLKLVQANGQWRVRFDFSEDSEPVGKCPVCGGNIIETKKAYGCENWRQEDGGCKFVIWKIVAQKEIPKEAAIQLLEKRETDMLTGFISRKGSTFDARLKLAQNEVGQFKVEFDFADDPLSYAAK